MNEAWRVAYWYVSHNPDADVEEILRGRFPSLSQDEIDAAMRTASSVSEAGRNAQGSSDDTRVWQICQGYGGEGGDYFADVYVEVQQGEERKWVRTIWQGSNLTSLGTIREGARSAALGENEKGFSASDPKGQGWSLTGEIEIGGVWCV